MGIKVFKIDETILKKMHERNLKHEIMKYGKKKMALTVKQ
jgi:hypothetical protein